MACGSLLVLLLLLSVEEEVRGLLGRCCFGDSKEDEHVSSMASFSRNTIRYAYCQFLVHFLYINVKRIL